MILAVLESVLIWYKNNKESSFIVDFESYVYYFVLVFELTMNIGSLIIYIAAWVIFREYF